MKEKMLLVVEGVDQDPALGLISKINGTQLHMFIGYGESNWDYVDTVYVTGIMEVNGLGILTDWSGWYGFF